MRVRQILSTLNQKDRRTLASLLPLKTVCPPMKESHYPTVLLSCFKKSESYSMVGIIAEEMLKRKLESITLDVLVDILSFYFRVSKENLARVYKSITTLRFLENVKNTRKKLDEVAIGYLQEQVELVNGNVEGHPDLMTTTQVFEVKMTGRPRKNWQDFLFQAYAYVALNPTITDMYLVLPLQERVWHRDVRNWTNRDAYLKTLQGFVNKGVLHCDASMGMLTQQLYGIGCHIKKQPTLLDTVKQVGSEAPYQIFLNGPQTSKVSVKDSDIEQTAKYVVDSNLSIYIHTPYILNLATEFVEGEWQYTLFQKYLEIGVRMKAKGVVIHVAKHTKQTHDDAVETMRKNLTEFKKFASIDCPILLETPAGQGTETLKGCDEFCKFVHDFNDARIRVCLDTCHVFACGHDPLEYVQKLVDEYPGMLKLVHFNDSQDVCGSCVDRHAFIGTGHIGGSKMTEIAEQCSYLGIPMVVE